jgi:MATE family, multidrug efflux pump
LAVPAFGALVAEPLFLLADSAIIGHLGTPELAGLGVAGAILSTSISLCLFLAYGTTATVSRLLGAGDTRGALRRGIDGLWLAGILGTVLGLLGLALAPALVGLFDVSQEASGHAITYLRISMFGVPSMLMVLASTGVLRGLQDTRTPLLVAGAANVLNVILNFVLVYGVGLGIAGSALGTVLAQTAGAAAYLRVVSRGARANGVSLGPDWQRVRHSFGASAPLVVRNLSLRAVFVIAIGIAARLGSAEVAAHQIAFAVWMMLAFALDAIAIAGQALVGRYLGAPDVAGARSATRRMVELSIGVGCVLAAFLLVARSLIAPLFTPDEAVQHLLMGALLVVALMQPIGGWVFALDGVLLGAGDRRYIAAGMALTVLIFAPLAFAVLHFDLGLNGLWAAIGVWLTVRLAVMALRARGSAWAVTGPMRA